MDNNEIGYDEQAFTASWSDESQLNTSDASDSVDDSSFEAQWKAPEIDYNNTVAEDSAEHYQSAVESVLDSNTYSFEPSAEYEEFEQTSMGDENFSAAA